MKKLFIILLIFITAAALWGQQGSASQSVQKFALVIGNGAYANFGTLRNAVNDANDMADALRGLGFTVDKLENANLNQMETAAVRLRDRLASAGNNAYGFFYYAGHGVQVDGVNYLIPANANIPDKDFLRERAVSAQTVLDMLNRARNALNIVVLDACRDFPAAWSRSTDRGLAVMHPPTDSIVMFATAAGRTASDGTGRNGLFTTHLLRHLKTPGIEVNDVFRRTMVDVARASNNEQRPAMYTDFAEIAFLGTRPAPAAATPVQPAPAPAPAQTAQPAPAPATATAQTYRVGDTGPAGGIVFYDKGSFSDGWRYLEAAPVDFQISQWGLERIGLSGTGTAIGTGKRNTELIIAALNRNNQTGRAAQLCRAYTLNGYNDWFLPSADELGLLYKNLKQRGLGGFADLLYWSSSQNNDHLAWGQYFDDGRQNDVNKGNRYTVRAVRAF